MLFAVLYVMKFLGTNGVRCVWRMRKNTKMNERKGGEKIASTHTWWLENEEKRLFEGRFFIIKARFPVPLVLCLIFHYVHLFQKSVNAITLIIVFFAIFFGDF